VGKDFTLSVFYESLIIEKVKFQNVLPAHGGDAAITADAGDTINS